MLAKGLYANTGNFVVAAVKYDEGLPEFIVLSERFAKSYRWLSCQNCVS